MVDFSLTEEQLALQTMARDFAEREIKPISLERDRIQDPRECFQWDIVEKGSRIGIRTLTLDKKYGGAGADTFTAAVVIEELCAGDLGVGVIFAQTLKFVQMIQWMGTEEQCRRFLTPFRDDHRFLIAATATEPDTGSDHLLPYAGSDIGTRTTAVLDGNRWVINGMKHFISASNRSKLLIVFARTDKTKPITQGATMFLVPVDTPGVSFGQVHNKTGERLINNAEVFYDNVRVPRENVLGSVGTSLIDMTKLMRSSNAFAGASVLGTARAAYEKALDYAKTRVQGGKPIIQHQAVGMMLAEMFILLEAVRNIVWKSAWSADRPEHYDPKVASMTKAFASEVSFKVTKMALEIHGGMGAMKEVGMEKLLRDVTTFLHSDGTNYILTIRTAGFLAQGI